MKRVNYLLLVPVALCFMVSCKNVNYKKTKSGLLYKIFPSDSKDSVAKPGNWVKLHYVTKVKDSVLQTSYGRMPYYGQVSERAEGAYNPIEILSLVKKGDSAVTVELTDTLFKRNLLPEDSFFKKGDRLITSFRVLEVFRSDSAYQADEKIEREKDMPRAMKERQEQMKKMIDAQMKQYEQSGEAEKEIKEMQAWLAAKKITATKTGYGTFVHIDQPGTGAPVELGKYVKVKYTGKVLATDSVFQAWAYAFKLGVDPVVQGWTEGLQLFRQGGKGTLYIPGFVAYGRDPGPARQPFASLIFDVEILEVSDKEIAQDPPPASR
ncbi:MAG TPA: FKBP-type peptidyl-prolyl cis-trans isomerase [Chitinophagaceae bacterium]|nr:FKBP-type peptidyl-prolyl cis-trans isomerase [Chitinophagaceae bacterium]